jgi:hypothetical protein
MDDVAGAEGVVDVYGASADSGEHRNADENRHPV